MWSTSMTPFSGDLPVKLEIEDPLEDEHGRLSKRSRSCTTSSSSSPFDQGGTGNSEFPISPSDYNPLDEPSPLGLRLRKSPSLLDLIQMKLSQGSASAVTSTPNESLTGSKKEEKSNATMSTTDKLKASNFSASLLRIGSWEYVSRYEGDLVAKCYFAKHKLVWEILEGGLKSKIEIQWSDIMALKTTCPDDSHGTLTVVLARQPLFFRETNPQPRKHTLWQATADFTDGQASLHRQHFLQCPPGVLNKHYEKLIQCDMRLNFLSRQPEIVLDSPLFETHTSASEKQEELKDHGVNQLEPAKGSPFSSFQDLSSPSPGQSSSLNSDQQDSLATTSKHASKDAPSPSSVMDTGAIERNGNCKQYDNTLGRKKGEQLKVPGIRMSMSMTDLVNHIGNCISEQMSSGNLPLEKASECQDMLENITQIWLSDNQSAAASDEKTLMKKVNSLCCLLQQDSCVQGDGEIHFQGPSGGKDAQSNRTCQSTQEKNSSNENVASEEELRDAFGCKQTTKMPRKDSFGDLLLHLPRIASFPNFLFDIAEDDEGQAR